MSPFFIQPPVDTRIAALASRQHAVVSLEQLLELGLSVRAVSDRAAGGRLHRVHRSVYSIVPRSLLTDHGHYMAAVLACGPGALLSHRAAADVHGLRQSSATKIDVTIPGRNVRRHSGIALHRSTTLTAADAAVVDGIPCTSVARTLFDLAEVVVRRQAERAFDQAESLQVFDLRAIEDQLDRNRTRPGARRVRSILDEHYLGSTMTDSELEEAMLAVVAGLPQPEVNVWLDLGDGEPLIKADLLWRAQRMIVEVDGREHHGTRQSFDRDRRRDQRAAVAGLRVIRTTEPQIKRRPGELRATVATLLAEPPPPTVAKLLAQAPPAGAGSPAAAGDPVPPPRSTRNAA
jgi:predicted transcriptional regulator of viral defense system